MLLLFLVVFPIVSYIYLKSGYDYRVEAMQELREHGPLPAMPTYNFFGDTLDQKTPGERVVLLHFVDLANDEQRQIMGKNMGDIHEQFDGLSQVVFWAGFDQADSAAVRAFLKNYRLQDPEQYLVFSKDDLTGNYDFLEGGITAEPYVMLADTSGMIRNVYNLRHGKELVRMIEHVTYLMPQEEEQEAIIKPEQEL